jgi:hypothetical protein
MNHDFLTLWTVRLACVFYVAAILFRWRWAWTAGLTAYLAHVAAAFTFHHQWSHQAAYRETARQTGELFGVPSGAGLYFNYLFTAVWLADVVWLWVRADSYRARPRWISIAVHSFMAFMFFNATIVFASGWTRWLAVAAAIALVAGSKIKEQARH